MRIYRSPEDGVVEIKLTSFGMKSLFALTAIVAGALCWYVLSEREPLKEGFLVHAVCRRSDWNTLSKSNLRAQESNYGVYSFAFAEPAMLFDQFQTKPTLWAEINIAEIARFEGDKWGFSGRGRYRPADRPVDGIRNQSYEPNTLADYTLIGGNFDMATHLHRYDFDFTVQAWTQTPSGTRVFNKSFHRLQYQGPINDKIIVFAIPIDDDLMHLVIVNLNHDAKRP